MKAAHISYFNLIISMLVGIVYATNLETATLPANLDSAYFTMAKKAAFEVALFTKSHGTTAQENAEHKTHISNNIYFFLAAFKPSNTNLAHYLSAQTYDLLNLITSKPGRPSWLSFFNQGVQTSSGTAALVQLLVHPVADTFLSARQEAINYFNHHRKEHGITQELQKILKEINTLLPNYVTMCTDQQRTITNGAIEFSKAEKINNTLYYQDKDPRSYQGGLFTLDKDSYYNNSKLALEARHAGNLAWAGLKAAGAPIVAYGLGKYALGYLQSISNPTSDITKTKEGQLIPVNELYRDHAKSNFATKEQIQEAQINIADTLGNTPNAHKVAALSGVATDIATKIAYVPFAITTAANIGAGMLYGTQGWLSGVKNQFGYMSYIHNQLIQLATLIKHLRTIDTSLIAKNGKLQTALPAVLHIHALFEEKPRNISPELQELIKLLETNTFTGKASFFSLKGRVLLAYKKFQECYKELLPALNALGQMDAYNACATIMQQSKNKFSLVKILTKENQPHFVAQDCWTTQGKIASGSVNVTSKEPYLTTDLGLFNAALQTAALASTLGIAPAHSASITPCTNIQSIDTSKAVRRAMASAARHACTLISLSAHPQTPEIISKIVRPTTLIIGLTPTNQGN